jgi:hypothetical protein
MVMMIPFFGVVLAILPVILITLQLVETMSKQLSEQASIQINKQTTIQACKQTHARPKNVQQQTTTTPCHTRGNDVENNNVM